MTGLGSYKKTGVLFIITVVFLFAVMASGCGKNGGDKIRLKDRAVIENEEFGSVYIDITIDDFNDLGFEFGDSVSISFSNGKKLENIPYYNGFYAHTGDEMLVGYPGYPYIAAAIVNGDPLWDVMELKDGDRADIELVKKKEYLDIQEARAIQYEDDRSLYSDDAVFANFRSVRAGNIKENILYRSASPCDNQHNRAGYTDRLSEEAKIGYILDLADNDEKISGYKEKEDFDSPYFWSLYTSGCVIPLAMNASYGSDEFREKFAEGLRAMTEHEGPYLVHCMEGKDRTGFVCMVLEALCGAGIDEIENDYMTTYANYYGITKESDEKKYTVIRDDVMIPMVRVFADDENADLKNTDLSACAEKYLLDSGLSKEQIDMVKSRLTK